MLSYGKSRGYLKFAVEIGCMVILAAIGGHVKEEFRSVW